MDLKLIKELRELTSAPMKDCKEALQESNNDLQKALDLIKVKGLNFAGASSKLATEGGVFIKTNNIGNTVSMVEVNSNTDFTANSDEFQKFGKFTAHLNLLSFLRNESFSVNDVEPERAALVSKTKENVSVRRWWVEQALVPESKVFSYVHSNNKIGVLVTLLGSSLEMTNSLEFKELGENLAMQIAAMSPLSISTDKLSQEEIDRQKEIFKEQLRAMNKPEASWDKILEGKMNKWFQEVCLENQEAVFAEKLKVSQVLEQVASKFNGTTKIVNFIRCEVGAGLEKKTEQLAEEVSKLL